MPLKLRTLLLAAVSAFAFSGCLLDEPTLKANAQDEPTIEDPAVEEDPTDENDPTFEEDPTVEDPTFDCASPLCQLQTPADTSLLTPDQKDDLVELIEAADDSALVTVTTIDVEALSDTTLRNEVIKDLQADLFEDMEIPVNPLLISPALIDSMLAGVQVTVSPNGVVNLQWSGTIADVRIDNVSLNIQGNEFLSGTAVVEGKVYSFTSLGGNLIAIMSEMNMVYQGECPPLSKTGGVQLTCAINVSP